MTKYMKNKPMAQGDILIVPVNDIPKGIASAIPEGKYYVVAHSETGHHHVLERTKVEVFQPADNQFIAYIKTLGESADIVHLRDFDTHETIRLEPNKTYRVHRQRESTPEGWRRAAD